MNLEDYLSDKKNYFCRYKCKYYKKVAYTDVDNYDEECPECGRIINVTVGDVEIKPCDYCIIDDFIREVRNTNLNVCLRKKNN